MKKQIFPLLVLFTLQISVQSQSFSSSSTEVVVPSAVSFYTGKGASRVQFADSLNGVAFAPGSPNYSLTTDGGETWREGKPDPAVDSLHFLWITGKDTLVAIVDSQYIFHSFDAGENWSMAGALPFGEKIAYGIFFNHKYGVVFNKSGSVIVTVDLGLNWLDSYWPFTAVKDNPTYDKGYLFAAEKNATSLSLIHSTDNGFTWQAKPLPGALMGYQTISKSESGFFIAMITGKCCIVSMTGEILKSFNPAPGGYMNSFTCVSENEVWGLHQEGWDNRHLRRFSFADTIVHIFPIAMESESSFWLVPTTSDKIIIYPKTKYDAIWIFHKTGHLAAGLEQIELPGKPEVSTLHFVNGNKGIAALTDGRIVLTNDGFRSWSYPAVPQPAMMVRKFVQRSESELFGICDNGNFLVTSDGGYTWSSLVSPFTATIKDASFAGRDTIYFITNDSLYFTSPSWQEVTKVTTGFSGGYFVSVDFYGRSNGTVIYQISESWQSKAMMTTDGGTSWTTKTFTDHIISYDPAFGGLYYFFDPYAYSGVFAPLMEDGIGRKIVNKGSFDFANRRKFRQKEGGLITFFHSGSYLFYNFGMKDHFHRIDIPSEMEGVQAVPADENTAYLLCKRGRILKFSRSQQLHTPTAVIRIAPMDGSIYQPHNTTFRWEEPWSVLPLTEYNLQFAIGDTSNIVHDIYGLQDTSYTLAQMADSALYFWRVRGRNANGWGNFNRWYSFISSVYANEPVKYQSTLTSNLTTAIMLPTGRLIVGSSKGETARTDQLSGIWTKVPTGTTYPILRLLHDPNNNLTFYLTNGNFLGYSVNNGVSWVRKEAPFGSTMINSLVSALPNLLFGAGHYGSIFKAVASPANWTNVWFSPNTGANFDIASHHSGLIAAVGEAGSFTISTDGGVNFRYSVIASSINLKRVSFAESGSIVALDQNGTRWVSADLGTTWTGKPVPSPYGIRDVATANGASAVIDTMGGIFTALSPEGGWRYSMLPGGVTANSVSISGDRVLFPSTNGSIFIMNLANGNPMSLDEVPPPHEFTLSQNYPNPFNPETVIRFVLPVSGYAKGVVYDLLGREVLTLIDGATNAGAHEVKFNASGLPSGIYIFRLQADNHSATIKMVLVR